MSAPHIDGRWDTDALRAGAGVSLLFAVPITVSAWVVDDSGLSALFFFGALFGFIVGAGCAAWIQRVGAPLSHGLVTAGGTYLLAQAVFISIRLISGGEVRWLSIVFTLNLVLLAGLIGGLLGSRLQAKGYHPSMHRSPSDEATP